MANAQGSYEAYCHVLLSGASSANLTLYFFPQPPARQVYFIDSPRIEAGGFEALKKSLQKDLAQTGIPFLVIPAENAASLQNSIIIIPSGVFPRALYERLPKLLSSANVLIYNGMPLSYLLEADGSIAQNENASILPLPQKTHGWETFEANSSLIYYNSKTLDKLGGIGEAADDLARAIISQAWQEGNGSTIALANYSGVKTLFTSSSIAQGYPRIYFEADARKGILDFPKASKFPGNLLHPTLVSSSRALELQIAINKSFSSSVFLSLSLHAMLEGTSVYVQKIGEANISRVWFRSVSLQSELPPGNYVIRLSDQYAQTHAASYLHVKEITVMEKDSVEGAYSFYFEEDGVPLNDVFAEVFLDNQTFAGRQPVSGGYLRINPKTDFSKTHIFHFDISGKRISIESTPSQSIFSFYAVYGIPAVLLVAGVYLLFRRRRTPFSLIFPDAKKGGFLFVRMKKGQALQAIGRASRAFGKVPLGLYISDIRRELEKTLKGEGKNIVLFDENVLEVLNSLKEEGKISNYGDFYMQKCTDARKAALLRQVYEKLVAAGRRFRINKDGGIICGQEEIRIHSQNSLPKLPKKGRLILVFENDEEIDSFRKSLLECEKEKLRFALAIRTKKAILTTSERLGEIL
ncbi:hypothetical protein AUJ17_02840 [Candidatus Micrarchaeota archaeon CG1_02_47_40]|nr:MAG: hypothetical protein AUJ17_02840 [Candidatus Micrarchaeota archaeon CG1_02_47_40]